MLMLFLTSKLPTIILGKREGKTVIINILDDNITFLTIIFELNNSKNSISIKKYIINKLIFFVIIIHIL